MSNSFFNKLTSSLNIQNDEDDAADFYQALDSAQERGGTNNNDAGNDEKYQDENGSSADAPGDELGDDSGESEEDLESDDEGGAETVTARLATAKSHRGAVRERAVPAGKQASRIVSSQPMTEEEDDAEGQLAIDVYQTDGEIIIKSVIAGVRPEDLDITIGDDTVTVRGSRKKDEQVSNENYYYQECYWGSFSRSIILPVEIDRERAEASFKNGILTVRLPKLEKNRTKKIRIAMG